MAQNSILHTIKISRLFGLFGLVILLLASCAKEEVMAPSDSLGEEMTKTIDGDPLSDADILLQGITDDSDDEEDGSRDPEESDEKEDDGGITDDSDDEDEDGGITDDSDDEDDDGGITDDSDDEDDDDDDADKSADSGATRPRDQ